MVDQFQVVTFFFFEMRTQPDMVYGYLRAGAGVTKDLIGTFYHIDLLFFHKGPKVHSRNGEMKLVERE